MELNLEDMQIIMACILTSVSHVANVELFLHSCAHSGAYLGLEIPVSWDVGHNRRRSCPLHSHPA